jgi:hypothetical protein
MKYLITLFLLIPSALNAMDQAPSAPNPKPRDVRVTPVFAHARADKEQRTVDNTFLYRSGTHRHTTTLNSHSGSNGSLLTLTEVIPNDKAKQITVFFSLKPNKDKPAYKGVVIAGYGSYIPLGDQQSDVRYFLNIPNGNHQRSKEACDCPTKEHQNDIVRLLAQSSTQSDIEKLDLAIEDLAIEDLAIEDLV